MNRLLALDQSSKITGWSVFENGKLIAFGKFDSGDADLPVRLTKIRRTVQELIKEYQIDEVALEDIQLQANVGNNVATYKALAEVIGVLTQMLHESGIPHELVHSSSWKSALGIKGRSRAEQKRAAQQWVVNTYHFDKKKPTQDECDSICLGNYKISKKEDFNWAD